MGLSKAGFNVVGVDINNQKNYPFEFIKTDALSFDLKGFDFIWASPPCQAFTLAQRIQKNKHPDLIAPIRKKLKKWGGPYCIENVVGAPLKNPFMLCGSMFDGLRIYRHRIFECNFIVDIPDHFDHSKKITKMGRRPRPGEFMHVVGNFSGIDFAKRAMKINWMSRNEIREAIPPAYSKFIAESFLGLA